VLHVYTLDKSKTSNKLCCIKRMTYLFHNSANLEMNLEVSGQFSHDIGGRESSAVCLIQESTYCKLDNPHFEIVREKM